MKTMRKVWGMLALVLTFALVLAACPTDSGGGGGGEVASEATYNGYDIEGKPYELVITKNQSRAAAYTPRTGDEYQLFINGVQVSSGIVLIYKNGRFTLDDQSSGGLTVKISGNGKTIETIMGGSEEFNVSGLLPDAPPSPPAEKPKLGVAMSTSEDDPYIKICKEAIESRNTGSVTSNLEVKYSEKNQTTQTSQVDQFINDKMNAIAIDLVDTAVAGNIINKAKGAGIPIVLFHNEPSDLSVLNNYNKAYYVGMDPGESGMIQGEIAVVWWNSNSATRDRNKNGKMDYLMLKGIAGNNDAEERTKYSIEAVKAAGISVNELAKANADWDSTKAKDQMSTWWSTHGNNVDVVFCNNDDMALGAIEFLETEGFFSGDKYLPVIGVDGRDLAIDAIEKGTLLGTVRNDPKILGKATYDLAYALAIGAAPASKSLWISYQKVTKDNYTYFK